MIKTGSSIQRCDIAYQILERLSLDIVNIHNGFSLDLKRIAVY